MIPLYLEAGSDKTMAIRKDLMSIGIEANIMEDGFYHYRIMFKSEEDLLLYKLLGKLTTKDLWRRSRKGETIQCGKSYMFVG